MMLLGMLGMDRLFAEFDEEAQLLLQIENLLEFKDIGNGLNLQCEQVKKLSISNAILQEL